MCVVRSLGSLLQGGVLVVVWRSTLGAWRCGRADWMHCRAGPEVAKRAWALIPHGSLARIVCCRRQ
jgi:hypothetical protein